MRPYMLGLKLWCVSIFQIGHYLRPAYYTIAFAWFIDFSSVCPHVLLLFALHNSHLDEYSPIWHNTHGKRATGRRALMLNVWSFFHKVRWFVSLSTMLHDRLALVACSPVDCTRYDSELDVPRIWIEIMSQKKKGSSKSQGTVVARSRMSGRPTSFMMPKIKFWF